MFLVQIQKTNSRPVNVVAESVDELCKCLSSLDFTDVAIVSKVTKYE